jgi:mono/diheme cytochrome c family protein
MTPFLTRFFPALLLLALATLQAAQPAEPVPPSHGADDYFADEVWIKVGARTCLECHKAGGDAEDSKFILQDPLRDPATALQHNREAFARMAAMKKGDQSRILLKATGGLSHGGEDVLKPDSTGYRVLAEYVRRLSAPQTGSPAPAVAERKGAPFFEGVTMLDDRRLLRRATLSLGARLPTNEELAAVEKGGLAGVRTVLNQVMKEDAFYDRLAEAFNDIFLIRGYLDGAESALSYENFSTTRFWTQKFDLSSISDPGERTKAGYKMAADYREALLREPLELIKYIVRNDRPFTEVISADYIMESPYTARGYGNYDELVPQFKDSKDPFEYVPVKLAALKGRTAAGTQKTATGFYPHAGILSTFQYLRRYPTTETNRNRLRSRMYYQHFLGVDVLELAARVKDAAAVTAKFDVPTTQASECVVCHKTLDPVAGIFQDFYSLEGVYGPRKDGWFKDIFNAGFEGEDLPAEEKWRSMQWLAERTIKDPRFAKTMVEHVYYILTGRKALLPPKGIDDPLFDARQWAYRAQHEEVGRIAAHLVQAKFNLKEAFQDWVASPFYCADSLATPDLTPQRQAELADIGVARLLGPEQVERKITAIFGKPWGRFRAENALLYGGIDAKEVTERATDPSGAMGAMQRMMADDVSCKNVAYDFSLEPKERRLFPGIEPDVLPGAPDSDQKIRDAIVHLHQLVLGRAETPASAEIQRTFELFAGILADAQERKGIDKLENYSCRAAANERLPDPHYTVRAWRGVVTYLLRQRDFLYE